jgi:hypothetical protein
MNRKIFLIISFICFAVSFNLSAQQRNNGEKRKADFEKFKAYREDYISKEMKLTEDESKAFWPLCNELQEKKFQLNREIRKELRNIYKAIKEGKTVSEAEYDKIIKLNADAKIKEAELDKEYMNKFKKFLSAEKIFKYQQAEQHLAKKMVRGKRDTK